MLMPKQMLSFQTHYGNERHPISISLPNKLVGNALKKFIRKADEVIGEGVSKTLLADVGTEFQTERGKLHKRFLSAVHKAGHKIPDTLRESLGAIVGDAVANAKTPAEIEFTEGIWWRSSDFSQDNSCWWGDERSCAKDMLIDNGGFAMLEYKNRVVRETMCNRYLAKKFRSNTNPQPDIYKVYDSLDPREETIALGDFFFAAATVAKLNLYTPQIITKEYDDKFGRVWVMPWDSTVNVGAGSYRADYFVLFNAYGRFLSDYAAILAEHMTRVSGVEWSSKYCKLSNSGTAAGKFYINGSNGNGKGYIVAPADVIDALPTSIDFEIEEPGTSVDCHDLAWCEYYEHTVSEVEEVIVGRRGHDFNYAYWSRAAVEVHAVYCESDGNTYARDFADEYLVEVDGDWYEQDDVVWSEDGDEYLLERNAVLINALDSNKTDWVSRYTARNECVWPRNVHDDADSKLYFYDDERVTYIERYGWYLIDGDGVVRIGDEYYVDGSDELEEVALEIDGEWYAKTDCVYDDMLGRWIYVGGIAANQIPFTFELELA